MTEAKRLVAGGDGTVGVERTDDTARYWPALDYPDWRDTAATLQLWTQIVGKVRRNTHGCSEARDGLQPAKGTLQEGQRRHESGRVSDMERGQYTCNDTHVMIWRSPAHHVAIRPLLRGSLYHPQIVQ